MWARRLLRELIGCSLAGTALVMVSGGILFVYFYTSQPHDKPYPVRPFTTMELLIDLRTMPDGWESSEPRPLKGTVSTEDSSIIAFFAETEFGRRRAWQEVIRWRNPAVAKKVYERDIVPVRGATPPDWAYESLEADQFDFSCRGHGGPAYPLCIWSGLYGDYTVSFAAPLIPAQMSLADMEQVVKAIDARMIRYLATLTDDGRQQ